MQASPNLNKVSSLVKDDGNQPQSSHSFGAKVETVSSGVGESALRAAPHSMAEPSMVSQEDSNMIRSRQRQALVDDFEQAESRKREATRLLSDIQSGKLKGGDAIASQLLRSFGLAANDRTLVGANSHISFEELSSHAGNESVCGRAQQPSLVGSQHLPESREPDRTKKADDLLSQRHYQRQAPDYVFPKKPTGAQRSEKDWKHAPLNQKAQEGERADTGRAAVQDLESPSPSEIRLQRLTSLPQQKFSEDQY